MVDIIKIDSKLADNVEKELYSLKVHWQWYNRTTNYYEENATADEKVRIDRFSSLYGPVNDTQRFTHTVFLRRKEKTFFQVRNDPKSIYRKTFEFLPQLIDNLQQTYISKDLMVGRIIINMQTIRPEWSMNAIHPDTHKKNDKTILYYVNNSDGDTFFFDDEKCIKKVPPVKGTAALYPSTTFHAGSTPIKTQTRVVVNIVFESRQR